MRKLRALAAVPLAAVLSIGLLLVGAAPASAATTHWVNDDELTPSPPGTSCVDAGYTTISAAVAAASPGDTIEVCAGTYNESVVIDQPLTLLGPNAGISWDVARDPEAVVTSGGITFLMTPGDGVTLDGFAINGAFGIYVAGSSNGTLIQNNITTAVTRSLTLDASGSNASVLNNDLISDVRSLHVDGAYTNLRINENRFSGPLAAPGIFFTGGTPPNSIAGFEFTDNEVLHQANMASNISDATVSGNTFNVVLPGSEMLLISLQNSTVTDNLFEGDDQNACLLLWGSQFGLVASDHVTISDNTFSDCGTADPSSNFAIRLSPDVHDIDITNNEISSGVEGVNTEDTEGLWDVTDEIHINFNNITDNTSFGVRNGQMGVLDAECNWWGAPDGPGPVGPGSGDNVSNNVDFEPWLIAPAPGGACVGGVSGKVTGGGQINVTGGRGSFGFNAMQDDDSTSGHLTYRNHSTGAHLDCTVTAITELTTTTAKFEGSCSSRSTAPSFEAEVEDNGEPGRNVDKFEITYGATTDGEGETIRAGNIQIHSSGGAAAAEASGAGAGTFPAGATFNGVSLSGLETGLGLSIAPDGTAAGQFVAVLLGTSLLGQPQEISVDGKVGSGSIGSDGSVTFSGSATVDLGDGSLPLLDVPFSVTATTDSLLVKLDTSAFPSATLTRGSITIE